MKNFFLFSLVLIAFGSCANSASINSEVSGQNKGLNRLYSGLVYYGQEWLDTGSLLVTLSGNIVGTSHIEKTISINPDHAPLNTIFSQEYEPEFQPNFDYPQVDYFTSPSVYQKYIDNGFYLIYNVSSKQLYVPTEKESPLTIENLTLSYDDKTQTLTYSFDITIVGDAANSMLWFGLLMNYYSSTEPVSSSSSSSSSQSSESSSSSSVSSIESSSSSMSSQSSANGNGQFKVQFFNLERRPTDYNIYLRYKVFNTGNTAQSLSGLTLRYYFTSECSHGKIFYLDYAGGDVLGFNGYRYMSPYVRYEFKTPSVITSGADQYLDISFSQDSGSILPGGNFEVQCRIADSGWDNLVLSDDYSFNPTATDYSNWGRICIYDNHTLIQGIEP